jgi:hypothetical protein
MESSSQCKAAFWWDHPQTNSMFDPADPEPTEGYWMEGSPDYYKDQGWFNESGDEIQWDLPLPEPVYSLRDPNNLPHASIYEDYNSDESVLGKHNSELKPEYWDRLNEWASCGEFSNFKTAMAADPDWWSQQSEPLYHVTHEEFVPDIMETGLVPWDDPSNSAGSTWRGQSTEPQSGHVYLCTAEGLEAVMNHDKNQGGEIEILEIDPSFLDPSKINADEDHIDDNDYTNPERVNESHTIGSISYRGSIPPTAINAVHGPEDMGYEFIQKDDWSGRWASPEAQWEAYDPQDGDEDYTYMAKTANAPEERWDTGRSKTASMWQYGECHNYAKALVDNNPNLRYGMHIIEYPDPDDEDFTVREVQHVFAHDDEYAYDSLGKHKLPYDGEAATQIDPDALKPKTVYNQTPEYVDEIHWPFDEELVEEAKKEIAQTREGSMRSNDVNDVRLKGDNSMRLMSIKPPTKPLPSRARIDPHQSGLSHPIEIVKSSSSSLPYSDEFVKQSDYDEDLWDQKIKDESNQEFQVCPYCGSYDLNVYEDHGRAYCKNYSCQGSSGAGVPIRKTRLGEN